MRPNFKSRVQQAVFCVLLTKKPNTTLDLSGCIFLLVH